MVRSTREKPGCDIVLTSQLCTEKLLLDYTHRSCTVGHALHSRLQIAGPVYTCEAHVNVPKH